MYIQKISFNIINNSKEKEGKKLKPNNRRLVTKSMTNPHNRTLLKSDIAMYLFILKNALPEW